VTSEAVVRHSDLIGSGPPPPPFSPVPEGVIDLTSAHRLFFMGLEGGGIPVFRLRCFPLFGSPERVGRGTPPPVTFLELVDEFDVSM